MNEKVIIEKSPQDFTIRMSCNEKNFEAAIKALKAQVSILRSQEAITLDTFAVLLASVKDLNVIFTQTETDYYDMRNTLEKKCNYESESNKSSTV